MTPPDPTPSEADRPDAEPPAATGVSRRVLLGGGLLVLGAVGGGVAGFVATDPPRAVVPDPVPPADVLAAIARERDLVATYDDALLGAATPLWSHLRAEHEAHAAALEALLPAGASPNAPSTGPTTGTPPSDAPTTAPPSAADLLAAEQEAAAAAKAACLAGNGTAAVLLACIAASEASHAAVLA